MTDKPKAKRGFAAMPPETQQRVTSMGGKAAHAQGKAHTYSREEARAAAHKRASLQQRLKEIESRYARLEEALNAIAAGKADEWIDRRSKYTRWIAYPGGIEIIRQVATLVLRDIDEPDVTDFWMKPAEK